MKKSNLSEKHETESSQLGLLKNISKNAHNIVNTHKQPVRAYVKIFPSCGIDSVVEGQYQILVDGKTILYKKDSKNFKLYNFNYVFTNQFLYSYQVEHMNVIDDCFEGKNQVIIANIQKQFLQHFLIGTSQDPGFIISIFNGLFTQIYFQGNQQQTKNLKQSKTDNKKGIFTQKNKQQSISISIFTSQDDSNKFIDLILGQKFVFYSKKDMDQYKDFYDKNIKSMTQFLIVLKIALIRYKQCCNQIDPLVFRIKTDFYDQIKGQNFSSCIHAVFCYKQSKIIDSISKKIQFSFNNSSLKGQDHGSLANYLQKFFKKSKLIYIIGIPFRKKTLQQSTTIFNYAEEIKSHSTQSVNSRVDKKLDVKINELNQFCLQKYKFHYNNFLHKQINIGIKLLEKVCELLQQFKLKWKNYCETFNQILQIQDQFYEKERFPISLQIQDYNVKSFMISKIYRLSQTYQMDDLSLSMEKLRTVKNQIHIPFKAMNSSKQLIQVQSSKNSQGFVKYYQKCLDSLWEKAKIMFALNYRSVKIYKINIQSDINIQNVLDNRILKQLISRLKNEATKIKQKQKISLRKIDTNTMSNEKTSNLSQIESKIPKFQKDFQLINGTGYTKSVQQSNRQVNIKQDLRSSEIFQLFKKQRRQKNKSNNIESKQKSKNYSQLKVRSPIKASNFNIVQSIKGGLQNELILNSSVIITKHIDQENYNFSLPKIAVIHKRTKR